MSLWCRLITWLERHAETRWVGGAVRGWVESHQTACRTCGDRMNSMNLALDMLRSQTLEPTASPSFDQRVARMVKLDRVRHSLAYWSPALVGAAVAALVLLTAIQIVSGPSTVPIIEFGKERAPEAKNSRPYDDRMLPVLAPKMRDQ